MADKQDTGKPTGSRRDQKQPYATEHEAYSFDSVKPPTDPEQRQAQGSEPSGRDVVEPARRGGQSEKAKPRQKK